MTTSAAKKPRGKLSVDDKRERALEFFKETADFFQLKELEKHLSKQKGIVLQTVKDILQSLIDDRLINCEKIGTSNYYWCFPSAEGQTKNSLIAKYESDIANLEKSTANTKAEIERQSVGKEVSEERTKAFEEFQQLEAQVKAQEDELAAYKDRDPDAFKELLRDISKLKTEADQWTGKPYTPLFFLDNIFALQSYITSHFGVNKAEFNQQFDIPDDLDYIEEV